MQVNSIGNNTNFGAMPDVTTRKILLSLERKGIDTTSIMRLMKETFADKFIYSNLKNDTMRIALYEKEGDYANQIMKIADVNIQRMQQSPKLFAKFLAKRLGMLAEKQSPEQLRINKIENFFGRYPLEDSYRLSNYKA